MSSILLPLVYSIKVFVLVTLRRNIYFFLKSMFLQIYKPIFRSNYKLAVFSQYHFRYWDHDYSLPIWQREFKIGMLILHNSEQKRFFLFENEIIFNEIIWFNALLILKNAIILAKYPKREFILRISQYKKNHFCTHISTFRYSNLYFVITKSVLASLDANTPPSFLKTIQSNAN